MFKAAIRVNKLTTIAQLRGASLHAQRHDETGKARVRDDAEPGFGLAWSKAENDRDYLVAFKAHKTELGAGERKGAPLCLQAIRDTDLSERDTEALSDFLMLKGEIARHKVQGRSYEPPEGALELDRVRGVPETDPWPLIRAVRSGAERVFEAAHGFGMGLRANNMGDGYPQLTPASEHASASYRGAENA